MLKRTLILLFALCATVLTSKASHYLGGEVYWKCIPNTGKYVFYLDFYRDCGPGTASINTAPTSLQVLNTPLPNNNTLSSIPMQFVIPEPGSPLGPNGGLSISPTCIGCGSAAFTNPISCTTQDAGTIEKYTYRSAPITLSGKPPSGNANQWLNGWVFSWAAPCCRSGKMTNISNTGTGALFKAIMFGDGRPTQDPCYDSSPIFNEAPTSIVCQKYDFQFDNNVTDSELDSLDFKWADVVDRSISASQYQPQFNMWRAGFSLANPTPTVAMNPDNKSATIDPKTGAVNMYVVLPPNAPANGSLFYLTSTQVDAWGYDASGNRIKKATVFRDMPFNVFDCPRNTFTYNDNFGNPVNIDQVNTPPIIQMDSVLTNRLDITVYAGDSISLPFLTIDTNASRCAPTLLTTVTIEPSGIQFDSTFSDARGNCLIQPCATLSPAPAASTKKISGLNTVGTRFSWQTTCDHIDNSAIAGSSTQPADVVFKFMMKTYDDFCTVPGVQYASINITVKAPKPLGPPILKCLTENSDGTYTLRWSGPQLADTTNSFESYELYLGQRAIGTSAPFTYLAAPIRVNLTDYNGSFTTPAYAPGQEYAFRMKTKWGCRGLSESTFSTPISSSNLPSSVQGVISENGSVLQLAINDADSYQWFKDGVSIPLTNSNSFTATASGLYKVEYYYDSCKYESNSYQFTFVGLSDNKNPDLKVTTFPNPTNGLLTIVFDQKVNVEFAEVYNLEGQLLFRKRNATELDLSGLVPNIYLLRVITDKGSITQKVIKK